LSAYGSPAVLGRAVIFDMDGLLVDSEPYWRRVEADAFDRLGVDIRPFLGHGLTMGLRVDEAIEFLCEFSGLTGIDLERLTTEIVAGMVHAITEEATLLPGVFEALALCSDRGLAVGLASGSTPPVIDAVLSKFGLRDAFGVVCSAIDDDLGKPHPAIFLRTAAALGVAPTACVVLEDSLNGCIAAKAARMRVIAIPHADDADDPRFSIADVQLQSLIEFDRAVADGLFGVAEPEVV
jgi:sugar-phosphatase